MAVSKRLRYEILRRDNYACRYCGATAPDAKLTVDHVTPTALGGTDTPDNLVTACEPCNSGKTSIPADAPLVAAVQQRQQDWRAAIAATAEQDREQQAFADAFLNAWDDADELPPGWRKTIDAYRKSGLLPHMWDDIVNIAMSRPTVEDRFRYCCGVARNRVARLQDAAAKVAEQAPLAASMEMENDCSKRDAAVVEAAYEAWRVSVGGDSDSVAPELAAAFRRSLEDFSGTDLLDVGRIVSAAEHAGYFHETDIQEAIRDLDHRDAWSAWISTWPTTWVPDDATGWGTSVGGPTDEQMAVAKEQITKLLAAGVNVSRLQWAAAYAGFHKSAQFYRGLGDRELEAVGGSHGISRTSELWRVAFTAGGGREPSAAETKQFFSSIAEVISSSANDGSCLLFSDLHDAASWAGAYQDPNLLTCLPVSGSVFTAASMLPVTRDVTAPVTRDTACDTPVTSQIHPFN